MSEVLWVVIMKKGETPDASGFFNSRAEAILHVKSREEKGTPYWIVSLEDDDE